MKQEKLVNLYKAIILIVAVMALFAVILVKKNDYTKDAKIKAEIYLNEGNFEASVAYTEMVYLYEGTDNIIHKFELRNVYDNMDALMKVNKYDTAVKYLDSYVYDYNRSKWED